MDIYSKPTNSKKFVPFTSKYPWRCLRNIPFSLARRGFTTVEKKNAKRKRFSELKTSLKQQKNFIALIESFKNTTK